MTFNPVVFERLLFPLNKQVYRKIQGAVNEVDRKHPGQLRRIMAHFAEAAQTDTQTVVSMPGKDGETAYPSLDIAINFGKQADCKLSMLRKSTAYKIGCVYEEKTAAAFTGSHLELSYYTGAVMNTFIVPLEYLLGFNEQAVLKDGSHQLYSHTILSPDDKTVIDKYITNKINNSGDVKPAVQQFYQKNARIYIGITKRTWQERYRQHCRDMGRGSKLLFHRALRGEMGKIGVIEHIVERAGLTEKQAMDIEEQEVEKRSLNSLYPNGLNMIPGGYAGLQCVRHFASRTAYTVQEILTADNVESVLVNVQHHLLNRHFNTTDVQRVNAEIARLWAEDIDYRINVMTGNHKRFSFRQIQAARVWHASGWAVEKILSCLQKLESKNINMDQLVRLLQGTTYASIPDVLI